jgi:hypothetical protein
MVPTLHQHIPRARNKENNLLLLDDFEKNPFHSFNVFSFFLLQRDFEE